ncbi:GPP34 family phosphoprotein [Actinoplanes sp. NPDC049316]|uniref:GOLPH3/VPS74 family protein n=1 Tax=Actinoplanes sp. NPDC049316 TaxID=3154727 RepID=UPI00342B3357
MLADIASLRDQVWLLGHDETRDLQPRIDARALAVGLAGATVADLLVQSHVVINQGCVLPQGRGKPADPVTAAVLEVIRDQPKAPLLTDVLREPIPRFAERVHALLVASGIIYEERRTLRSVRYRLVNDDAANWIRADFVRRLYRDLDDPAVDTLCALVWALNLHSVLVLPYSTSEAEEILRAITDQIPVRAGPTSRFFAVPQVALGVRAAIGDLATAAF